MEAYKEQLYKQLMWDYNISPEDVDKLMTGKAEYAGHYTINTLFKKMLESFPWFVILEIVDIETAKYLLTEETIAKLKMPELRKKYTYVKNRLQQIIPASR